MVFQRGMLSVHESTTIYHQTDRNVSATLTIILISHEYEVAWLHATQIDLILAENFACISVTEHPATAFRTPVLRRSAYTSRPVNSQFYTSTCHYSTQYPIPYSRASLRHVAACAAKSPDHTLPPAQFQPNIFLSKTANPFTCIVHFTANTASKQHARYRLEIAHHCTPPPCATSPDASSNTFLMTARSHKYVRLTPHVVICGLYSSRASQ